MISLHEVKADLRLRHDSDDVLLTHLINAAVDECLRFMNRAELPRIAEDEEDPGEIAPSVRAAVFLLVQAGYDRMKPDEVELRRRRAEQLCFPYRDEVGV